MEREPEDLLDDDPGLFDDPDDIEVSIEDDLDEHLLNEDEDPDEI